MEVECSQTEVQLPPALINRYLSQMEHFLDASDVSQVRAVMKPLTHQTVLWQQAMGYLTAQLGGVTAPIYEQIQTQGQIPSSWLKFHNEFGQSVTLFSEKGRLCEKSESR